MNDPRLDAIRRHPLVGEHQFTFLLCGYSDSEILARLDEVAANSVEKAVAWAIDHERTRIAQVPLWQ